jgi:16S rRNA (adenine1518-N6/adenine1519-N6)-dimethyltransferase
VAVERDERCLPALAEIAARWPGRLEVAPGDALAISTCGAGLAPPVPVVANLPYNVGTELLVRWLTPDMAAGSGPADADVPEGGGRAHRRAAGHARPMAGSRCSPSGAATARIAMTLPPEAFTPPPKVRSAVVHLEALPEPRYPADARVLSRVVAAAFNQRRKMLRAALKGQAPDIEDRLRAAGIDPTQRAEDVPLEAFCALARELA